MAPSGGGATGTGTDWGVAANWVGDVLPGSGDDAVIGSVFSSVTITSSSTLSVNSVTSEAALSITGGTFSVIQPAVLNAGLSESGGTFYSGSNLSNASAVSVGSGGTLVVGGLPGLVSVWHAEGNANDGFGSNPGTLTNGATTTTSGKFG